MVRFSLFERVRIEFYSGDSFESFGSPESFDFLLSFASSSAEGLAESVELVSTSPPGPILSTLAGLFDFSLFRASGAPSGPRSIAPSVPPRGIDMDGGIPGIPEPGKNATGPPPPISGNGIPGPPGEKPAGSGSAFTSG